MSDCVCALLCAARELRYFLFAMLPFARFRTPSSLISLFPLPAARHRQRPLPSFTFLSFRPHTHTHTQAHIRWQLSLMETCVHEKWRLALARCVSFCDDWNSFYLIICSFDQIFVKDGEFPSILSQSALLYESHGWKHHDVEM